MIMAITITIPTRPSILNLFILQLITLLIPTAITLHLHPFQSRCQLTVFSIYDTLHPRFLLLIMSPLFSLVPQSLISSGNFTTD